MQTRLIVISLILCVMTLFLAHSQPLNSSSQQPNLDRQDFGKVTFQQTSWRQSFPDRKAAAAAPGARAQLANPAFQRLDGEFSASVKTALGEFRVPVQVASNHVECIHWTQESCLKVFDAAIENGFAEGMSANGDLLQIQLSE